MPLRKGGGRVHQAVQVVGIANLVLFVLAAIVGLAFLAGYLIGRILL